MLSLYNITRLRGQSLWLEYGEWRLAFAFDPRREAILPDAGDKSGVGSRRFYRALIRKAGERCDRHLARLAKEGGS